MSSMQKMSGRGSGLWSFLIGWLVINMVMVYVWGRLGIGVVMVLVIGLCELWEMTEATRMGNDHRYGK